VFEPCCRDTDAVPSLAVVTLAPPLAKICAPAIGAEPEVTVKMRVREDDAAGVKYTVSELTYCVAVRLWVCVAKPLAEIVRDPC
jgi:hypothetical protein